MESYGIIPDHLFCVAGGTSPEQIGFLADIKPEGLISCLEVNYYAAIFIAQVVLKLWVSKAPSPHSRHITFISSAAAFVGIPAYIAYTPTKWQYEHSLTHSGKNSSYTEERMPIRYIVPILVHLFLNHSWQSKPGSQN
jgi:NAD(P)-dependent dehydrogenase (short-subunit alcohol dehydrogenase family)